jgi:flagellar basal body-associated protein FliL
MEQGDFRQPAQQQGGSYSPPPWPDLTKSEPPQKKSSKGLLIVISVIVVLLLIIGGGSAFALLRGKGSHTSQTNATTPSANGTASKAVTPALPTPTTPANPVTGNTGTVGQPIQAGANWIVTVTHVDETNSSAIPPVPGQAYLEINISLKNTQATSQLVSSLLQFTLVDSSGHSYHEAVGDTNVRQPLDANVAPGQTLSGQLPYEVPQSMHTFVLTFKYALISGSNASISWALHV